jgi:ribulose-5-phosphate 4-epimerase/fuculose-1-phosphate aldolase
MTREREEVVAVARSLFTRGLTHGRTGNVSVRVGDQILITPTGASLGTIEPDDLSTIGLDGQHISGPRPSKEAFLHATMLRERPQANAVVHTHSIHAAAVSCLADLDPDDAIPALTAYFAMRVGTLPLLPYYAPGDANAAEAVAQAAVHHSALLLSNHGPVVAGPDLNTALDVLEELEHTAKAFLLLQGLRTRPLTEQQRSTYRTDSR